MKIAVVGGGTAGLVAAITLKNTYPTLEIDLIKSDTIGTIGVGEGSTEHWSVWMNHVGIEPYDIIKNCGATFKAGIMFKGWSKHDYLQSVEGMFAHEHMSLPFMYAKFISEGKSPKDLVLNNFWNSEVPFNRYMDNDVKQSLVSQYHFNTEELTKFLIKFARQQSIGIFDDVIDDVVIGPNGVEKLIGKNQEYKHDFYIDATGFKRLLIGKLGAQWQSYSKYLGMKEAITFQTPDEEEYPIWTLAQAMSSGWMFRIPVWGRKGNGYIFDSDFIDADQAKKEAENFIGNKIDVAKHIKFDPGALKESWIKNVVAIGLSSSFVEPLEASSIGTSIQQSFLLAEKLVNYDQNTINQYNSQVNAILDNIRDFIVLHYITDRNDTPFWKGLKDKEIPESLASNLEQWKRRLPIGEDFETITSRILFNEYNHIIVLHSLDHFDKDAIAEQYRLIPQNAKDFANNIEREAEEIKNIKTIPHKMMIDLIRRLS